MRKEQLTLRKLQTVKGQGPGSALIQSLLYDPVIVTGVSREQVLAEYQVTPAAGKQFPKSNPKYAFGADGELYELRPRVHRGVRFVSGEQRDQRWITTEYILSRSFEGRNGKVTFRNELGILANPDWVPELNSERNCVLRRFQRRNGDIVIFAEPVNIHALCGRTAEDGEFRHLRTHRQLCFFALRRNSWWAYDLARKRLAVCNYTGQHIVANHQLAALLFKALKQQPQKFQTIETPRKEQIQVTGDAIDVWTTNHLVVKQAKPVNFAEIFARAGIFAPPLHEREARVAYERELASAGMLIVRDVEGTMHEIEWSQWLMLNGNVADFEAQANRLRDDWNAQLAGVLHTGLNKKFRRSGAIGWLNQAVLMGRQLEVTGEIEEEEEHEENASGQ